MNMEDYIGRSCLLVKKNGINVIIKTFVGHSMRESKRKLSDGGFYVSEF